MCRERSFIKWNIVCVKTVFKAFTLLPLQYFHIIFCICGRGIVECVDWIVLPPQFGFFMIFFGWCDDRWVIREESFCGTIYFIAFKEYTSEANHIIIFFDPTKKTNQLSV